MKRILVLVMALIMTLSLAACGGSKAPASTTPAPAPAGSTPAPTAEAKPDLGDSLVLYSSMTENDLNNLLKCFGKKYPGINVEIVNGSAGELTARIKAEKDNPQGDIMWGGLSNSDGSVHSEIFEHWLSDYESEIMPDYKSNNGFYSLDHLSTVVLCVNTELEKKLGLDIKGYADLLNPALKGKIVLADPNSSSSAWNNICNIMAVYGNDSKEAWDFMEGLLKNGLVISTSSSVCFKSVQTGEYVVGLTYEDGADTLLKSGATNIKMVYPAEGASASAFGCAVIKGAKHMEAAKAMVNYLMSAEGQSELGTALGTLRFTNSKAKYDVPWLPANESIKWVTRDIDWLIKNKEQVLKHWNELYTSIHK